MRRTYRTPKGTDLPLLNLKGKDYLPVNYRLVWFREEHPDWRIETEFIEITVDYSFAKAVIRDQTGNVMAMAHKFEDRQGFADFREKSETGAIGRALAMVGYGTQFCADELDEGSRVVDTPLRPFRASGFAAEAPADHAKGEAGPQDPGERIINIGKKFLGMKFKDVPRYEIEGFCKWLVSQAEMSGRAPTPPTAQFLKDAKNYIESLNLEAK